MIYDVQKASLWKRFSAYLFDFIIFTVVFSAILLLMYSAFGYKKIEADYNKLQASYEGKYKVDFDVSEEDFNKFSDEKKDEYNNAYKEFKKDPKVMALDDLKLYLILLIIAVSLIVSHILLEFVVPMIFKNGQTLGKKIFGIGVMRVDGVKVSALQMFIRTLFGKCTIETMLPVFFVLWLASMPLAGLVGLAALAIIQFVCIVATKMHTPIHELLAGTVTVDLASQLIFETPEDLIEYKKKVHAKEAERADYF